MCCQRPAEEPGDSAECMVELSGSRQVLLALEAACCLCCAVSGTRAFLADARRLRPDRCDNRIAVRPRCY